LLQLLVIGLLLLPLLPALATLQRMLLLEVVLLVLEMLLLEVPLLVLEVLPLAVLLAGHRALLQLLWLLL
jgi:hypothetical protein